MTSKYIPQEFEKKWISQWDKNDAYKTPDLSSADLKSKVYCLVMFPYPSGAGLHVGHVRVYTGTDVLARFFRMTGKKVLHPMGWDAFGLPAENAAIKEKKNPIDIVPRNIANFKRQMKMVGLSYDWNREFSTTDPQYYRWTQWLFIQFYKAGLLYKKLTPVYFCEFCKTGLAEEEVLSDGTHERCGKPITRKELPQWIFRITKYADRLLEELKALDWPKGILEMQKNWIGKEKGLSIKFQISNLKFKNRENEITVWTKYWETVFGTTFLVVAPEYKWLQSLIKEDKVSEEVKKYVAKSLSKTDEQRMKEEKEKTGVFTGHYAVNPVNGQKVPIWVADYVLADVGTGAVMGVPAHDERDFAFAKKYNLPIIQVVSYKDKATDKKVAEGAMSYEGEGILVNSDQFNGLSAWGEGKEKMAEWMIEKKYAQWQVHYHLRDWIFSRQRYWGEPIPMIYCKDCGWIPVPEDQLPVELPYVKSYEPTGTGESPLSQIKDWVEVRCPQCGKMARRETDTMPNWAGSCWYFLAFPFWDEARHRVFETASPPLGGGSPRRLSQKQASSPIVEDWKLNIENFGKWFPVDWYVGGAEHAVLHLLYSRFWVKALQDLKFLDFSEPFLRLRNVGIVLAEDNKKMSKSVGNVINPDDVVAEYGADTLRVYEMFMAPFNQEIAWSTNALQGAHRFLKRVWDMYQKIKEGEPSRFDTDVQEDRTSKVKKSEDKKLISKLHKTIQKVTSDIGSFKFNTAIAAMMEFLNAWEKKFQISNFKFQILSKNHAQDFLKVLAPFAPFITEQIWHDVFGKDDSIHLSSWPSIEKKQIIEDEEITIPVQVNGKLRGAIKVESRKSKVENEIVILALRDEKVKKYVGGKDYKVIYVSGKILNLVTS